MELAKSSIIEFIKTVGAKYYNSEYEMYLNKDININRKKESLEFVKAKIVTRKKLLSKIQCILEFRLKQKK